MPLCFSASETLPVGQASRSLGLSRSGCSSFLNCPGLQSMNMLFPLPFTSNPFPLEDRIYCSLVDKQTLYKRWRPRTSDPSASVSRVLGLQAQTSSWSMCALSCLHDQTSSTFLTKTIQPTNHNAPSKVPHLATFENSSLFPFLLTLAYDTLQLLF